MRAIYERVQSLHRHICGRRMRDFAAAFQLTPRTRVLDVGGTPFNWSLIPERPQLTLLDVTPFPQFKVPEGVRWVHSDGQELPFDDGEFDVVFSSSAIEHVGDWPDQRRLAWEIRRVGRGYWVQTPNRRFPVDPHVFAIGLHWLPRSWRYRLVRPLSLWGLLQRPSPAACRDMIDDIHLLAEEEIRELFPDAVLTCERIAGLAGSLIAMRPPAAYTGPTRRRAASRRSTGGAARPSSSVRSLPQLDWHEVPS